MYIYMNIYTCSLYNNTLLIKNMYFDLNSTYVFLSIDFKFNFLIPIYKLYFMSILNGSYDCMK